MPRGTLQLHEALEAELTQTLSRSHTLSQRCGSIRARAPAPVRARIAFAFRQTLQMSVRRAGVTQLAECLLPKQNVAGSNPVSRSSQLLQAWIDTLIAAQHVNT